MGRQYQCFWADWILRFFFAAAGAGKKLASKRESFVASLLRMTAKSGWAEGPNSQEKRVVRRSARVSRRITGGQSAVISPRAGALAPRQLR
jgi:hypothetical protein